jgi:hypothetical protein
VDRIRFLLADAGSYRSHRGASQYLLLLAAIAAVVLAIVGLYLWNTHRKPRASREESSPEDLLAELCNAHELSRLEQSLITNLARSFELAQPALLFVDPWPFDRAAETADPDASRYRALRQKLFGSVD